MKTFQMKHKLQLAVLVPAIFSVFTAVKAQLKINERSSLVMNGNVSLVVNNGALTNNGTFVAGTGNVKFSGSSDSSASNLSGSSNTVFYDLTVSKSASGMAIKSSASIRNSLALESGDLYTNDILTLKSDTALTARVAPVPASSTIRGKVSVERYIPARRAWRILTAPVTGSNTIFQSWQNNGIYTAGRGTYVTGPNPTANNGLDASPQNNVSMKKWDANTQGFSSVLNTYVAISAGDKGNADNTAYFTFVRGDRSAGNFNIPNCNATTLTSKGTLQQGTQTFPVASAAGAYTMIGNPYASPVNFSAVTRNNVVNRFYVWDPTLNSLGGYVMLDDLSNTGTYTKSVNGSTQTKEIQSGQGFLVQTAAAGAASVVFNESNKSSVNNAQVFRPTETPSPMIRLGLHILQADGSSILADGTFAEFSENFSAAIDNDDALKFTNINECLALVRNNTTLAAERRPLVDQDDTLFVKLWRANVGYNYQFSIDPSNFPGTTITLVDRYTGIETAVDVFGTTTYNFAVDANAASTDAGRFIIILHNYVVLPVSFTAVTALEKNKTVAVEWKVASELNITTYVVERSADGSVFTPLGEVAAKNITAGNNIYRYNDVNPIAAANFYRITAIEKNGTVQHSEVVKVVIAPKAASFASIYPNPVIDSRFNLHLNIHAKGEYKLILTNNIGQVICSTSKVFNGSSNTLPVSLPVKLSGGVYQLEVISPAGERNVLQLFAE